MDWTAAAHRARHHLGARKRTFSEAQSLELIDFFAEHGTVTSARMQQHGSADFVGTILGHVTTAVHGGGSVPKGGWLVPDGGRWRRLRRRSRVRRSLEGGMGRRRPSSMA